MSDLWPDDIGKQILKTPATILKEQATILAHRTQGLVLGKLKQRSSIFVFKPYDFGFDFSIVAPSLGNYTFALFTLFHTVALYPVMFDLDSAVRNQIGVEKELVSQNEEEFINHLRMIFATERVKSIITSLISQIKGVGKAD